MIFTDWLSNVIANTLSQCLVPILFLLILNNNLLRKNLLNVKARLISSRFFDVKKKNGTIK